MDCRFIIKKPYAINRHVEADVLRGLVVDLATVGSRCFPRVYSVIRDTEGNSGLSPVSPMVRVLSDGDDIPLREDSDEGSDLREEVGGGSGGRMTRISFLLLAGRGRKHRLVLFMPIVVMFAENFGGSSLCWSAAGG